MIAGFLMVGVVMGIVSSVAAFMAGWGIVGAMLAYVGGGMLGVLLCAAMALVAVQLRRKPMLEKAATAA